MHVDPSRISHGSPHSRQSACIQLNYPPSACDRRELIFRCSAVLASPTEEADAVMVVVPRAFNLFQTLADMRARVSTNQTLVRGPPAVALRVLNGRTNGVNGTKRCVEWNANCYYGDLLS